ncbi:MAG: hypothetical protein J7513_10065 [Solirubrobacteraceae bacterium]|nr:hypothetical protein [Solirubrobacteraceae bacterium]
MGDREPNTDRARRPAPPRGPMPAADPGSIACVAVLGIVVAIPFTLVMVALVSWTTDPDCLGTLRGSQRVFSAWPAVFAAIVGGIWSGVVSLLRSAAGKPGLSARGALVLPTAFAVVSLAIYAIAIVSAPEIPVTPFTQTFCGIYE